MLASDGVANVGLTDAEQLFGGELTESIVTVAREARVQVEFNTSAVSRYRLLGYENRAMADQDFNNPDADAGEVLAARSVTALYEIEPAAWGRDPYLGTVRLHWLDPDTGSKEELVRDIGPGDLGDDFGSASPGFRVAATVGGFAEILRESPYVNGYTLDNVDGEAQALAREFRRADVDEFGQLTAQAARLEGVHGWW